MKTIFTASFFVLLSVQSLFAAEDPLKIPDTDEGMPGIGPLRRTEWFRGVWSARRGSWPGKSEAQRGSVVFFGDSITQGRGADFKKPPSGGSRPSTAASLATPAAACCIPGIKSPGR
ncbi:MAG: hypothetical protein ACKV19_16125 [Verrucomicrobiales bacterium]